MPEIEPTDSSTHSLVDVDSPHVSSVPSDYSSQSIKTDTQAERLQHEAEDREREEEQRRRIQRAKERAKEAAKEAKEKAKEKASEARRDVRQNADNPVYMANAVVVAAFGAVLGYGAYRKYVANELSWKVVGLWTGVVGLFAAGDYYVSQYVNFLLFSLEFHLSSQSMAMVAMMLTEHRADTSSRNIHRRDRMEVIRWLLVRPSMHS